MRDSRIDAERIPTEEALGVLARWRSYNLGGRPTRANAMRWSADVRADDLAREGALAAMGAAAWKVYGEARYQGDGLTDAEMHRGEVYDLAAKALLAIGIAARTPFTERTAEQMGALSGYARALDDVRSGKAEAREMSRTMDARELRKHVPRALRRERRKQGRKAWALR